MKKLSPFNPQLITEAYFPQFVKTPDQINYGQCFEWALYAYDTFEQLELFDVGIHAFVRYNSKFYDSERLKGVKDWQDLPAADLKRDVFGDFIPLTKYSRQEFVNTWRTQPMRFGTSWEEMSANVEKVLKANAG